MACYRLNTLECPILLWLNMLDCMAFDVWVKLPVADRSHPQSKNFVTVYGCEECGDSKLNDSPASKLF